MDVEKKGNLKFNPAKFKKGYSKVRTFIKEE